MRISTLAKNSLQYLSVLAMLAAMGIGLFIGKGFYPASPNSSPRTTSQVWSAPHNLQLLPVPQGRCIFPLIYTSLPPKCKTADGKFIPVPGSSYLFLIPERK
jgi:hypothetical protein